MYRKIQNPNESSPKFSEYLKEKLFEFNYNFKLLINEGGISEGGYHAQVYFNYNPPTVYLITFRFSKTT